MWHVSEALPWLGVDSLMPAKECAHASASWASAALHRDPNPIFMKLPGTPCLPAYHLLLNSEKMDEELQHLPGAAGGWRNSHQVKKTLQSNIIFCSKVHH